MNTLGAYGYLLWGNLYNIPFKESIGSLMPVVDEFVVLTDLRFNDGAAISLSELAVQYPKLNVVTRELDLNNPGVDGISKAIARSHCESDILISVDFDEVFREQDLSRIREVADEWSGKDKVVGTGVINWFNGDHFKMGSAGWIKERFSANTSHVAHGIPVGKRIHRGRYFYAKEGTDGAGYISLPACTPLSADKFLCNVDKFPRDCKNKESIWVHHYSWYSLVRKWRMKPTWHYFWGMLYGKYENLDSYILDIDGQPVDFWQPEKSWKPLEDYIPGIKDEMQDKTIRRNRNIDHPAIMKQWIDRQIVYYPPRLCGIIPERRYNIPQ